MEKNKTTKSGFISALDNKFLMTERGSSVSQEVIAGIGAFLIAVCALLVNTQLIGTYYGNYAGAYLAFALMAIIGTVLIAVLSNKPVLMTANICMSSLIVTYMGSNSGLTYPNVLVVIFFAGLLSLVITLTPLRKVFIEGIPDGVKKALPVGVGLYVMGTALKSSGIITTFGEMANTSELETLPKLVFWIMIAAIALVVVYLGFGRKNPLGSTYLMMVASMWAIGIIFFMEYFVGGQTATTLVYERVNLIVATDGASPYNILNGITALNIGQLFSMGFDFSAYSEAGGNVAKFVIQSVLTFLFFGMYTNLGNYEGALEAGDMEDNEDDKCNKNLLVVGSALATLSPIFGVAPVTVGAESSVQTKDGGKTGLSSIVCGIGFIIAAFSWVFFALTATSTNGVGMWINETEIKLAAYVKDSFQFADIIMVFAGATMLKAFRKVDFGKLEEIVPFAITIAATVFAGNIVCGIAFGSMAAVIIKLISSDRKNLSYRSALLAVILVAYILFFLIAGTDFVVVMQQFPMMPMGG